MKTKFNITDFVLFDDDLKKHPSEVKKIFEKTAYPKEGYKLNDYEMVLYEETPEVSIVIDKQIILNQGDYVSMSLVYGVITWKCYHLEDNIIEYVVSPE